MKFSFKKCVLPIITLISLSSCGGDTSIPGLYQFQMGPDKGVHMGIYLDLTTTKPQGKTDNGFILSAEIPVEGSTEPTKIKTEGTYTYYTVDSRTKLDLTLFTPIFEVEIPAAFLNKIIYAYHDAGKVNVVIPVSMENLTYQMYWYGLDISPQAEKDKHPTPVEHPVGSLPTDEEVKQIQQGKGEQGKSWPEYRVWNTVTLTLAKKAK